MAKVTGVIAEKKITNGDGWERIAFKLAGGYRNREYSIFSNRIKDNHTKEVIHSLAEGQEVEFEVQEAPNKNKPGEVYYNIVGAVKVERIDRETGESLPPQSGPSKQSGGDFPLSMKASYAKDAANAMFVHVANTISYENEEQAAIIWERLYDYAFEHICGTTKGKKQEDEEPPF